MKKGLRLLSLLFAAFLTAMPLVSCDTGPEYSKIPPEEQLLPVDTPITDSLEFAFKDDYMNHNFKEEIDSGKTGVIYGEVHLMGVTDGDTVSWKSELGTGEASSSLRMAGINTPESTANVEPWGVKASKFASELLADCAHYAIVTDVRASSSDELGYERMDNNGTRYLGFFWYQKTEESPWRCFNLEMIEQGYTENTLFTDSDLGYLDSFLKAGEKAKMQGLRVAGKVDDPDYDYNDDVVETTIWYVRDYYSEIGIDVDSGTSGKRLRLTALVVGLIGDNLVLRDVVKSDADGDKVGGDEDGEYRSIYAYAGFGSALASVVDVGDVVQFYCRATKFPKNSDTIQLSDIETSFYGDYKFEVKFDYNPTAWEADGTYEEKMEEWQDLIGYDNDIDPVVPERAPSTKEELSALSGLYVTLQVDIRIAQGGEYDENGNWIESGINKYYNEGNSGTTIYAYLHNTRVVCNLRIDHNSFPRLSYNDFKDGETWQVTAYLNPYFDNFQLALLNYKPSQVFKVSEA